MWRKVHCIDLCRQGRIPAINLGSRLVRIERKAVEQMFPIKKGKIYRKKEFEGKAYIAWSLKIVTPLGRLLKNLVYRLVLFINIFVNSPFLFGRLGNTYMLLKQKLIVSTNRNRLIPHETIIKN